jgi:hypothetical protein
MMAYHEIQVGDLIHREHELPWKDFLFLVIGVTPETTDAGNIDMLIIGNEGDYAQFHYGVNGITERFLDTCTLLSRADGQSASSSPV